MTDEAAQMAASEAAPLRDADGRTPLCFVVDEQSSIRHFLSLVLQGAGIDTQEFAQVAQMREAIATRRPDLIFLDVPLDAGDALTALAALGKDSCTSAVQLISNRGGAVLENVRAIGEQHKLRMLPVLKKPFDTSGILKVARDMKLGHPASVAARIGLDEAMAQNWLEFWFQPKIDLRRRQLAGAEMFARARHPQYGILSPSAFMPGAEEASLVALAERALNEALTACKSFSAMGVSLRIAVNLPVVTLHKIDVAQIVSAQMGGKSWPGLMLDLSEEEILGELDFADTLSAQLKPLNVHLAIDDFGRGHALLARCKTMPFTELKLDRTFVTDCGTDKINAPLCKTVIDLAHQFEISAAAIGIEKAGDVLPLVTMGCDYGQGFLFGQPMAMERFTSLLKQRANTLREQAVA